MNIFKGHITFFKAIIQFKNSIREPFTPNRAKAEFVMKHHHRQSMVDNGEIAAVVIDDEATLKRVNYYPEKNLLILKAENPDYEDLVYTGEQLDHIIILGKAVAFQSDVR